MMLHDEGRGPWRSIFQFLLVASTLAATSTAAKDVWSPEVTSQRHADIVSSLAQFNKAEVAILDEDDQCGSSGDSSGSEGQCAFSALQTHGKTVEAKAVERMVVEDEVVAEEAVAGADSWSWKMPWAGVTSAEKCCKCADGKVDWSASGKCTFCGSQAFKTSNVRKDCKQKSSTFKGSKACSSSCVMLTSHLTLSLLGDAAEDEWPSGLWPLNSFGTMEQCCLCEDGKTGWSASGTCSSCGAASAKVKKSLDVASDCVVGSSTFLGKEVCQNACVKRLEAHKKAAGHEAAQLQSALLGGRGRRAAREEESSTVAIVEGSNASGEDAIRPDCRAENKLCLINVQCCSAHCTPAHLCGPPVR